LSVEVPAYWSGNMLRKVDVEPPVPVRLTTTAVASAGTPGTASATVSPAATLR
jgi:hypothetical protein